jgi:hypothetical protein
MILEKVSAESTEELTSSLPSSLVVAASLIIVAVIVGGSLILTLDFATVSLFTYNPEPMSSGINSGVYSYAFY